MTRRGSPLSLGAALDLVAQQCARRHLDDTTSWLSELALSGEEALLAAPVRHTLPNADTTATTRSARHRTILSSVHDDDKESEGQRAWLATLQTDDGLTLTLDQLDAEENDALPRASHQTAAEASQGTQTASDPVARWRRLHTFALVLLNKGEYQRCHELLANAIQEDEKKDRNTPRPSSTAGLARHSGAGASVRTLGVPSSPSRVPPCIRFLCLYALFLAGQRTAITTTTTSAAGGFQSGGGGSAAWGRRSAGSMNPHLRRLRGMLLEALATTTTQSSRPAEATPHATASSSSSSPHQTTDANGVRGEKVPTREDRTSTAKSLFGTEPTASPRGRGGAGADLVTDPFLSWLLGVVLRELGMKQESAAYLLASVQVNPFLWCAWQDLSTLVSRDAQLDDIAHTLLPDVYASKAEPMSTPAQQGGTNAAASSSSVLGDDVEDRGEPMGAAPVGALPLMLSVFLAHTRAALGVAPVPTPDLMRAAGLVFATKRAPVPALAEAQLGRGTTHSAAEPEEAGGEAEGDEEAERTAGGTRLRPSQSPLTPHATTINSGTDETAAANNNNNNNNIGNYQSVPLTVAKGGARTGSLGGVATTTWDVLLCGFPTNTFFTEALASYAYHQRHELDAAQRLYERLLRLDPCRLEGTTDYSNILFIRNDRLSLSSLAQRCHQLDPARAESHFVVGNYYVLLRQHERSVAHFRRAVEAQPRFVAAWTLLGHAYLETKNTTAAVEAYSVAVELDPRDYRGWYNIGQVYELLQAYHHALYYYWHTTSLRSTDPRMWLAVANCLEHDGRLSEAIVCLARAEACEVTSASTYPALVRRIAEYYISEGNVPRGCVYLTKLISAHAATAEDLLFAMPFLVQQRLREVDRLVEMPARSPSYDSALLHHGGGSGSGSTRQPAKRASGQAASAGASASAAPAGPSSRVDQALAVLSEVEGYLNTIEQLDSNNNNMSSSSTDGVMMSSPASSGRRGEGRSALTEFVTARRRDIHMTRRLIQYGYGGGGGGSVS